MPGLQRLQRIALPHDQTRYGGIGVNRDMGVPLAYIDSVVVCLVGADNKSVISPARVYAVRNSCDNLIKISFQKHLYFYGLYAIIVK